MATAEPVSTGSAVVARLGDAAEVLGDWSLFSGRTLLWTFRRWPSHGTFINSCYLVGVRSLAVIIVTGAFIGMVLAVQAYSQFHALGLTSRLGSLINVSVVRELGPVLAATMLAGRVGSAMAAELATMRVTEQIDALACLGANPIHYLVVPRFLACVLLIPLLTAVADLTGVLGGAFLSLQVYHVEWHDYWVHASESVSLWDLNTSLLKSVFFGAAIALISCHRGFNSKAGAEGVGRAAAEAFVASFITILALDFFLAMFLTSLYERLWPLARARMLQLANEKTSMSAANLITLDHVSVQFGPQAVLRDIDLGIAGGQTVVVIGESGCGKTCLLKLVIALLRPTSGKVIFDGRDLATLGDRELTKQRLRLGFLFQGAALFDSLTVFDNVALGLREQRRCPERELRERVRQSLLEVGLPAGVEAKKPAELSGGMKKRVGLARALALDPEVMLYDEPTTGLDPLMTDVINELILQTRQRRPVTSLVVTHEMRTVQKVADRVIMFHPLASLKPDEGQVLYDGPPEGLAGHPDMRVRRFIEGDSRLEAAS